MAGRPGSTFVHCWILAVMWAVAVCCTVAVVRDPAADDDDSSTVWEFVLTPSWFRTYLQPVIYGCQFIWLIPLSCYFFATSTYNDDKPQVGEVVVNVDEDDLEGERLMRQSRCLLVFALTLSVLTLPNFIRSRSPLVESVGGLTALFIVCYALDGLVVQPRVDSVCRYLPDTKLKAEDGKRGCINTTIGNGVAAIAAWIVLKLDLVLIKVIKHFTKDSADKTEYSQYLIISLILLEFFVLFCVDQRFIARRSCYILTPYAVATVAVFGFSNFGKILSLGATILPTIFGFVLIGSVFRVGYSAAVAIRKGRSDINEERV